MSDHRYNILLVEDNPADLMLLEETFVDASRDYELTKVERLSEALSYLKQTLFDAVLLDLGLPDSQGIETFASLHKVASETPILVLTGLDDDQIAKEAIQKGAQDFLIKKHANHYVVNKAIHYAIERNKHQLEKQKSIEELNNKLETLVKERTQELIETNEELESFSYSVSHDLRAPLRAIAEYAEALKEDYEAELNHNGITFVQSISRNVDKMTELIRDLLDFSRLGKLSLEKVEIDINVLVAKVIKELQENSEKQNHQVLLKQLPRITADYGMIQLVFTNLIGNAFKFSSKTDEPLIEIGHNKHKNEVVYYVKDNGVGFNQKYADKLFQPFQRLHSESEFKGTGIGLAIVKRVISKHGGNVWAESSEKGSTFYFSLPSQGGENASIS